jgi:glycerol-3-phosphate dehydrogenase
METEQLNQAVAEALAAYEARQAEKAAAKAAEDAKIEEAVKAAKAQWEQESAASRRLPTGAGAPTLKFNRRWNDVSPAEHALIIDVLRSAKAHVSDECVQALAARLEGEDGKLSYSVYGADAQHLERLMADEPALAEPLHPNLPYPKAVIVWAARHEMARTVEDALSRRTRALLLDARAAAAAAPETARLMAQELGHDETWQRTQTEEFQKLAKGYHL